MAQPRPDPVAPPVPQQPFGSTRASSKHLRRRCSRRPRQPAGPACSLRASPPTALPYRAILTTGPRAARLTSAMSLPLVNIRSRGERRATVGGVLQHRPARQWAPTERGGVDRAQCRRRRPDRAHPPRRPAVPSSPTPRSAADQRSTARPLGPLRIRRQNRGRLASTPLVSPRIPQWSSTACTSAARASSAGLGGVVDVVVQDGHGLDIGPGAASPARHAAGEVPGPGLPGAATRIAAATLCLGPPTTPGQVSAGVWAASSARTASVPPRPPASRPG